MDLYDPQYHYPVEWINQTEGPGRPAGIYLLDGVTRVAARRSAAERALLDAGALYVATLCFGGSPYERTHPGGHVERIGPRRLLLHTAGN